MAVTAPSRRHFEHPVNVPDQPGRTRPQSPSRRAPLEVVAPRRRVPRHPGRPALLVSAILSVGSLVVVAGAHAVLVEGQVRLTQLQAQVSAEGITNRQLQDRVARLENPSQIVSEAQAQGLQAPTHIVDLPQVPLTPETAGSNAGTATAPAGQRTTAVQKDRTTSAPRRRPER